METQKKQETKTDAMQKMMEDDCDSNSVRHSLLISV
jgi:hypothetical protein